VGLSTGLITSCVCVCVCVCVYVWAYDMERARIVEMFVRLNVWMMLET